MVDLRTPYLLFLGDAADQRAAKTAAGIAHWKPSQCLGQLRLPDCHADLGLPDLSVEEAVGAGARTMIVGVANRGGVVPPGWEEPLIEALESGLDVASGLHMRLGDRERLRNAAARSGSRILDVRRPPADLPVATGSSRSGLRLLTVGTDCSVGKMFTSLALAREMESRGLDVDFRATGQTGIFISGSGIAVDAVVGDFIAGAAEVLSPAADSGHWDVIEGQGSLFHPSFAGVTLGLLHGSRPDAMVLCLEPGRSHMRGLPEMSTPDVADCVELYERCARVTNPEARVVGLSANTSSLDASAARERLKELGSRLGLPAVDPVRTGVGALVDALP